MRGAGAEGHVKRRAVVNLAGFRCYAPRGWTYKIVGSVAWLVKRRRRRHKVVSGIRLRFWWWRRR